MNRDDELALAAHPYRPVVRLIAGLAGLSVVVVAVWFAWAALARHRLSSAIDAVRRRGEPTTLADFPNPPLPAGTDAAPVWRFAADRVSSGIDGPTNSNLQYHAGPAYPPRWWDAARASEAANAGVFPAVDAAAARPSARWVDGPSTAAAGGPPYNDLRSLANVLFDSALLAHFGPHYDDRCLARLHDLVRLADAIDQQPSVLTRLVSDGIRAQAVNGVFLVANGLDLGPPDDPRRQSARQLIADLWTAAADPAAARPVLAERVTERVSLRLLSATYPVLGPLVNLTAARTLAQRAVDVRAAAAATAPASAAVYAAAHVASPPPAVPRLSRAFDAGLMPNDIFVQVDWTTRAACRAGAVALALRLYQADHADARPAALSALVPTYLPAIPTDPLAAGSPPIGYGTRLHGRPDASDRPLLFVGARSFDPLTAPLPVAPATSVDSGSLHWFDLDPWPLPSGR